MLSTVSVSMSGLGYTDNGGDEYAAWLIQYRLVDCPVLVSNLIPIDEIGGMVPPIAEDPVDRMSADRFRELLIAYCHVTKRPFGALRNGAWVIGTSYLQDLTSRTFAGPELWIITPGVRSKREYLSVFRNNPTPGYLFSFPEGAAPEYIGVLPYYGDDLSPMD